MSSTNVFTSLPDHFFRRFDDTECKCLTSLPDHFFSQVSIILNEVLRLYSPVLLMYRHTFQKTNIGGLSIPAAVVDLCFLLWFFTLIQNIGVKMLRSSSQRDLLKELARFFCDKSKDGSGYDSSTFYCWALSLIHSCSCYVHYCAATPWNPNHTA